MHDLYSMQYLQGLLQDFHVAFIQRIIILNLFDMQAFLHGELNAISIDDEIIFLKLYDFGAYLEGWCYFTDEIFLNGGQNDIIFIYYIVFIDFERDAFDSNLQIIFIVFFFN